MSAYDELRQAADKNGWIVTPSPGELKAVRGGVTVYAEFSIDDRVIYASRNFRRHSGPGKKGVVLGWLREEA